MHPRRASAAALPGVQCIRDPIAKEVEPENQQRQNGSGDEDEAWTSNRWP